MKRLRISAISYLNTAPLMWDFERSEVGSQFEIQYTLPSQCAAALRAGAADIGIIPAAAYASIPGLAILPEIAIASRRPVRSILLVSRVPVEQVQSVALDTSSLTSVALTKVLFANWWGDGETRFTSMAPNLEAMLQTHDAGLLIGDPALKVDRSKYVTYDLAEEWIRLTGKPFVFAFWAVREDAMLAVPELDLAAIFRRSRDHGLVTDSVEQIAREWAPRLALTQDAVRSYLTQNIHYSLDSACLEGLRLFYQLAEKCGALPPSPPLRFVTHTAIVEPYSPAVPL
jgi:chorismate dehydratase